MSLILTRRIGERIMIGDDVSITVLGIVGNQVKIAIEAPKNIEVHREEIYQKIQAEKITFAEKTKSKGIGFLATTIKKFGS